MADGIKARIGAVWKDLTPSIKVASAWKTPDAVHIRVGGVWKQVWAGVSYALSAHSHSAFAFGSTATAYYKVSSNGNCYRQSNAAAQIQIHTSTNWVRPTTEAPGSSRVQQHSATGDTGFFVAWGAASTWFALTSTRQCYVYDNTPGAGGKSVTFTAVLDALGDATDTYAASITLSADREDF